MLTWNDAVGQMRVSGRNQAFFAHALLQHPRDAGMLPAVGAPSGQRATYSVRLAEGDALYVYDYGTSYLAKLVKAARAPLAAMETTLRESPGSSVLGATAIGALLGLALGGSKESTLVGAIVGGMVGLSAVSVANADSSPATSDVSRDVLKAALKAMQVRAAAQSPATTPATIATGADAWPKRLPATTTPVVRKATSKPTATMRRRLSPTKRGTP
jgi:hypothetical protein